MSQVWIVLRSQDGVNMGVLGSAAEAGIDTLPQSAPVLFTYQSSSNASSSSNSVVRGTFACTPGSGVQGCSGHPKSIHSGIPLLTPQYPRGLTLSLNITCIFGIATDTFQCIWARIHQGGFSRLKSYTGSGHPSWPYSPPNTLEASHSASTSLTSSVSLQMLSDAYGPGFIKVVSADLSPV